MLGVTLLLPLALWGAQDPPREKVQALIERLNSEKAAVREEATQELKALGQAAVIELEEAAENQKGRAAAGARGILETIPLELRYQAHLSRTDKKSGIARYSLGKYCVRIGIYSRAVHEFELGLKLDDALSEQWSGEKARIAREVLRGAERSFERGREKEAIVALRLIQQHFEPVQPFDGIVSLVERIEEARQKKHREAVRRVLGENRRRYQESHGKRYY